MMKKIAREMNLAEEAAKKAGRYLGGHVHDRKRVLREEGRETHFQFDREAEDIIVDALRKASDYGILTEERGVIDAAAGDSDYFWIVDPLDGSINYSEGIPLSCVSVSLWKKARPLLGVIYDFNRDHLYAGIAGAGASLNGTPIRVRSFRGPSEAILCTGFPAAMDLSESEVRRFVARVSQFRKIRMLGTAALSLAFVAAGFVDAYYEKSIKIWDVAAGLALVEAAGGEIMCSGFPESHIVEASAGASRACLVNGISIRDSVS